METNSLVFVPQKKRLIPRRDWSKQSLRKCLLALGISEEEMRYRKGARSVREFWAGEVEALMDLAKVAWKKRVVLVHEANDGGDPEQWKILNTIYSTVLKKLAPFIRRSRNNQKKVFDFECMICGNTFKKKIVSWVQYKSSLCDNHECKKEYYRRRSRKQRAKERVGREIHCPNPKCGKRLVITNWKGRRKYCSEDCRITHWNEKNAEKIENQRKIRQEKRPKWREWWVTLTPEQQEEYRIKHSERTQKRHENETPEQRTARLAHNAAKRKEYLKRRAARGNPIKNYYVKREVWLAKKKEQLKDKPWIYETILQKYLRPDGTISSVALK